jgi:hypothetical protein
MNKTITFLIFVVFSLSCTFSFAGSYYSDKPISSSSPSILIPDHSQVYSGFPQAGIDPYQNYQSDTYWPSQEEIDERDFQNRVYVNKVRMKDDLDYIILDYFHWIRTEAPVEQKLIAVEVDTHYDYYYNCISEVLAYNFTKEQDGDRPFLDSFDYFFYIRENLSETIDICRDLRGE